MSRHYFSSNFRGKLRLGFLFCLSILGVAGEIQATPTNGPPILAAVSDTTAPESVAFSKTLRTPDFSSDFLGKLRRGFFSRLSILRVAGAIQATPPNRPPILAAISDTTAPESVAFSKRLQATDPDLPAQTLTFGLASGPTGLTVSTAGMLVWNPTEVQGPSTHLVTVWVRDGTLYATNQFTVRVTEVNRPPVLVAANLSIPEMVPYSKVLTATDLDFPTNTLSFKLVSGPTGMTLSNDGRLDWTPTESQGPSTTSVSARVSDGLSWVTNVFSVSAAEVNRSPIFDATPDALIPESVAFSKRLQATDPDLPTQTLTFGLASGPTGLTVSTAGILVWNPTEAQGPSTHLVTVWVKDGTLYATNQFTVMVIEVNMPPVLGAVNLSIPELVPYSTILTATDPDFPTNTLSFELVSGPTGMTLSNGGRLDWTPTESQGPMVTSVLVKVSDEVASVTNSFTLTVTEVNAAPSFAAVLPQTVAELSLLSVTLSASDTDFPAQTLIYELVNGPSGMTVSVSGALAWTPTESQGPMETSVLVKVSDGMASVTNSFTLTVTEVNTPPTMTVIPVRIASSVQPLQLRLTATDFDEPVQPLTYGLVSGPTNLVLDADGSLSWAASPGQRYFTNQVQVYVSDGLESSTNSFDLIFTSSFSNLLSLVKWQPPIADRDFVVTELMGRPDEPGAESTHLISVPSTGKFLWLKVHGVHYPDMISLRVNDGTWISLNNTNCVFDYPGDRLNGMGGPLDTLSFRVVNSNLLNTSNSGNVDNSIKLKFNRSNGISSGFRLLDINILGSNLEPVLGLGRPVIEADASDAWLTDTGRIYSGSNLWYTAELRTNWTGGLIKAKCTDCHAESGADLQFFNYTAKSIWSRAEFHGLNTDQGKSIAAYIRSLNTPRVGTPWDPPYQPGPGVDSVPDAHFSAGAGLKWVLPSDHLSFNYIFPGGPTSNSVSYTSTLNIRELPIAIPLPDWNSWLPHVHPKDSIGDSFQSVYDSLEIIREEPSTNLIQLRFDEWHMSLVSWFYSPTGFEALLARYTASGNNTRSLDWWSMARWRTVKSWEIINERNLEGAGASMYSWPVHPRSWPTHTIFLSSPHFTIQERTGHFLRDGSPVVWDFMSHQWYWLQMVLNDSNHRRQGTSPIDWSYLVAFTQGQLAYGLGTAAQLTVAQIKAGEATTYDPTDQWDGFNGLAGPALEFLFTRERPEMWDGYPVEFRDQVIRSLLAEFSRMAHLVGREYFRDVTGELKDDETDNTTGAPRARPWIRSHSGMLVFLKQQEVAPDIIETMRDLGKFLWPQADWERF